jgi:hypothetical protein
MRVVDGIFVEARVRVCVVFGGSILRRTRVVDGDRGRSFVDQGPVDRGVGDGREAPERRRWLDVDGT